MGEEGAQLPQDEIDSIFKQATGKSITRPTSAPTVPSGTSLTPPSPVTPSTSPPQRAGPATLSVTPVQVAPTAPSTTTPVQASAPVPSNDILKTIQATMADLAQRITKVETGISNLNQKEREVPDVSVPIQRLSQGLETVVKDIQKVNNQVRGVLRGLEGTPGYDIRNSFTCEFCGSHGFIAIPMRCTKCKSEGWWGWWPKQE